MKRISNMIKRLFILFVLLFAIIPFGFKLVSNTTNVLADDDMVMAGYFTNENLGGHLHLVYSDVYFQASTLNVYLVQNDTREFYYENDLNNALKLSDINAAYTANVPVTFSVFEKNQVLDLYFDSFNTCRIKDLPYLTIYSVYLGVEWNNEIRIFSKLDTIYTKYCKFSSKSHDISNTIFLSHNLIYNYDTITVPHTDGYNPTRLMGKVVELGTFVNLVSFDNQGAAQFTNTKDRLWNMQQAIIDETLITVKVEIDTSSTVDIYDCSFEGSYPALTDTIKTKINNKTNYVFEGIYFGEKLIYDTSFATTEKITLFGASEIYLKAKFTIKKATIVYDANNGLGDMTSTYVEFGTATKLNKNSYVRAGWDFLGWSTTKDGAKVYDDEQEVTITSSDYQNNDTITLYAVWNYRLHYKIKLYSNYEGSFEEKYHYMDYDVEPGTTIDLSVITPPYRTGYQLLDWVGVPDTMPNEDISVYATWKIGEYYINFDTDGGTSFESLKYEFNDVVDFDQTPVKKGYKFSHWEPSLPQVMPGNDVDLKAIYVEEKYTVLFVLDNDEENVIYEIGWGLPITNIPTPTKLHYDFVSWDINIPEEMPKNDLIFFAVWQSNVQTITIKDGNNGNDIILSGNFGDPVVVPTFVKEHYHVISLDKEIPSVFPDEDIVVTINWEVNSNTIYFDTDGGSEIKPMTLAYRSTIELPANPTKEGYRFAKWSSSVPTLMPDEDIHLIAIWETNQYTITFIGYNDVILSKKSYYANEKIEVPKNLEVIGYTFKGWSEEVPTYPTKNLEFKANYEINVYKVSYYDGETVLASSQFKYLEVIKDPGNIQKKGYGFLGWYKDKDFTESFNFDNYLVKENVNIYARLNKLDTYSEITKTDGELGVDIKFNEDIPQDVKISLVCIDNNNIDTAKKDGTIKQNYYKTLPENYAIACIYQVSSIQVGEEFEFEKELTFYLQIPSAVLLKPIVVVTPKENGEIEVVEGCVIENGKIYFTTNFNGEFAILYKFNNTDIDSDDPIKPIINPDIPEEKSYAWVIVVACLSVVLIGAGVIFIIVRRKIRLSRWN